MTNERCLALEISRNKAIVRKVENDGEKTTMRFLEYWSQRQNLLKLRKGKPLTKANRDQLSKFAEYEGVLNKFLKHCLQSEEVVRYWDALTSVAVRGCFLNTTHFAFK